MTTIECPTCDGAQTVEKCRTCGAGIENCDCEDGGITNEDCRECSGLGFIEVDDDEAEAERYNLGETPEERYSRP